VQTIIERLKHPYNTLFGGEILCFRLAGDLCLITDQGGSIPTREDFEELIGYCLNFYDEFPQEEIERLVEEGKRLRLQRQAKQREQQPEPTINSGYVYVLAGGGYYKIGKTIDIDSRLDQIEPQLPFEVELVHTIETDDIDILEDELHERYAAKRTNGEWFQLSESDIKNLKRMS
jgi:hypothetical protein